MEFLGHILLACLVALLLFVAATFGFALLTLGLAAAAIVAAWVLLGQAWRRWRFLHAARERPPRVIEGEYEDISQRHKK